MSVRIINGKEFTQVALARPAGLPFSDQDGSLVGVNYQDFKGGGVFNLRLTRKQAEALRYVLTEYLLTGQEVDVIEGKDGKVKTIRRDS